VRGVVVAHHVERHPRVGHTDLLEEPQEFLMATPQQAGVLDPAVATSSAADNVVVPLRTSSWVCFSGTPGMIGRIGAVRSNAWTGRFHLRQIRVTVGSLR